jgi:LacI family gluconate utilization system Gnt-I transcriptional repressor
VSIKGDAIGRQAARFIVDRVEGRDVAERVIDIGFTLIERQSS